MVQCGDNMSKYFRTKGDKMGVVVEGFLAPDFEQVAQMFEASYETASDDHWDNKERAQLCVFIGDTLVIDLFAKPDSYDTYNSDTLQVIITCRYYVEHEPAIANHF